MVAKNLYKNFPKTPGVYLMKNARGGVLYVGKAGNLQRRVASYFQRPQDYRISKLLSGVKKIDYKKTETAIEALILESELIKKFKPPFNIRDKDDKSFLYVEITKEKFPRVLLVRGGSEAGGEHYGPFTSASSIREALKILRRIFSWSDHSIFAKHKPCFNYQLGLCPGVCFGAVSRKDYLKNIRGIRLFFHGKKAKILKELKDAMVYASKKLEFEKAEKIRRQIFSLEHIQDVALINEKEVDNLKSEIRNFRIEGYDISNISGTSSVGAMVVFINSKAAKSEYRKFKIRALKKIDDVGMLKEILGRRFLHLDEWPLPHLILVNGARQILEEGGLKIPVVGIAKGKKRKKNEIIGNLPVGIEGKILIRVRDEAHYFAQSYHKNLRKKQFLL